MKPSQLEGTGLYQVGGPDPRPSRDELPLFTIVWGQSRILFASTFLGVLLGLLVIHHSAPMFVSVGTLYVQRNLPRIVGDPILSFNESANYLSTQCEIIKSSSVVAEVAKLPRVAGLSIFAGDRDLPNALHSHLSADLDPRNDVISVSFQSSDAAASAVVVNAFLEQYIAFAARQHRDSAGEILKLLQKQKAACDDQLQTQLTQLKQLKSAHPALSFASSDHQQNLAIATLNRFTESLTTARLSLIDAKAAYDAAVGRTPSDLQANPSASDSSLRAELAREQDALADLRHLNGQNSSQVQKAEATISRLKQRLAEIDRADHENAIAIARQQWDVAAERERAISEQVEAQKKQVIEVNAAETEYAALDAQLQRNQKLSDLLDSRIKELNLSQDASVTGVSVLEPAHASSVALGVEKSRIVVAWTLGGLVVGLMLAFVAQSFGRRVGSSVEEIEQLLPCRVLGAVPHAKNSELANCVRVIDAEAQSHLAEAYRSLRTMIVFGSAIDFRTLVITSPCAGDGKTTAAVNLAIAIARSGQRTLLIDGDLRRPSVHKLLQVNSKIGLSDVISGKACLKDAIVSTEVEGLSLLLAGSACAHPSELLSSNRVAEILSSVSIDFDKIVIDSPPLGLVSDGRILAARAQATVLIVRAGRSDRTMAQEAVSGLINVGAQVVGVVLNDQPLRFTRQAYYPAYAPAGASEL